MKDRLHQSVPDLVARNQMVSTLSRDKLLEVIAAHIRLTEKWGATIGPKDCPRSWYAEALRIKGK